jgi:hypothetical protein
MSGIFGVSNNDGVYGAIGQIIDSFSKAAKAVMDVLKLKNEDIDQMTEAQKKKLEDNLKLIKPLINNIIAMAKKNPSGAKAELAKLQNSPLSQGLQELIPNLGNSLKDLGNSISGGINVASNQTSSPLDGAETTEQPQSVKGWMA